MLGLAKLLVDLLNEGDIACGLPKVENEKGIAKLERFLRSISYPHVERDITLLRRIQTPRSRIAAHTSGSSGREFLESELNGQSKKEFVTELMRGATQMCGDFATMATPAAGKNP